MIAFAPRPFPTHRTNRGGGNRGVHGEFLCVEGTSQSHGDSASPKALQLQRDPTESAPPAERVRPRPRSGHIARLVTLSAFGRSTGDPL